jgi:hypothetical protein
MVGRVLIPCLAAVQVKERTVALLPREGLQGRTSGASSGEVFFTVGVGLQQCELLLPPFQVPSTEDLTL